MPFPKYTFLLGGTHDARFALAEAIYERHQDSGMIVLDFEQPLREAALAFFFDNDVLRYDLTKTSERDKILPGGYVTTVSDFLKDQERFLISHFGGGILGRLAASSYNTNNWGEVFDQTLIRDAMSTVQIGAFCDGIKARPQDCHVVDFTQTADKNTNFRIVIPHTFLTSPTDLASQLTQLEAENLLCPKSAASATL